MPSFPLTNALEAGTTFDEQGFKQWYHDIAIRTGINADPDDPRQYYDYRKAYSAKAEPQLGDDGFYHWPSQFKFTEEEYGTDHPNRFVDGVDTVTGQPEQIVRGVREVRKSIAEGQSMEDMISMAEKAAGITPPPTEKPQSLDEMLSLAEQEAGLTAEPKPKPEVSADRIWGAVKEGAKEIIRTPIAAATGIIENVFYPSMEKMDLNKLDEITGLTPNPEYRGESSGWLEDLARGGPQMVGQIGASIINPLLGIAWMGLQIAGTDYENAVKEGRDPGRSLAWGMANAIMQTPLEYIGIKRFTKLWKPHATMLKWFRDLGETMGVEWFTEFVQGIPEVISDVFSKNPQNSMEENAKKVWEALPEGLKQSAYEGTLTAPWALLGIPGIRRGIQTEKLEDEVKKAQKKAQKEVPRGTEQAGPIDDEKVTRQFNEAISEYEEVTGKKPHEEATPGAEEPTPGAIRPPGQEPAPAREASTEEEEPPLEGEGDALIEQAQNRILLYRKELEALKDDDSKKAKNKRKAIRVSIKKLADLIEETQTPEKAKREYERDKAKFGLISSTEGTEKVPGYEPSVEVKGEPTPDMGPTNFQRLRGMLTGVPGRMVERPSKESLPTEKPLPERTTEVEEATVEPVVAKNAPTEAVAGEQGGEEEVAPEFQNPAQMVSKSGRKLSPYPSKPIVGRMAQRRVNETDAWLIKEAITEAESNGDDYNATMFKGELPIGKQGLPQASRDSANMYLFGRDEVRFEHPAAAAPTEKGKEPTQKVEKKPTEGAEKPVDLLPAIKSLQPAGQDRALVSISELRDKVVSKAPERGERIGQKLKGEENVKLGSTKDDTATKGIHEATDKQYPNVDRKAAFLSDEGGRPITVYHGTTGEFSGDFTHPSSDAGFFFTTDREAAKSYGERIISAKLRISRPYEDNAGGSVFFEYPLQATIDLAKERGHDGLIIHNIRDYKSGSATKKPIDLYIAFNPDQVEQIFPKPPESGAMTNEAFDKALLELSQQGKVALHHHDFPSSLTPEKRSKLLKDGDTYYVGVVPKAEAKAPAEAKPERKVYDQNSLNWAAQSAATLDPDNSGLLLQVFIDGVEKGYRGNDLSSYASQMYYSRKHGATPPKLSKYGNFKDTTKELSEDVIKALEPPAEAVAEKKAEGKATPGRAWINGQFRPITQAREITKGKDKGKVVVQAGGRRHIVNKESVKEWPKGAEVTTESGSKGAQGQVKAAPTGEKAPVSEAERKAEKPLKTREEATQESVDKTVALVKASDKPVYVPPQFRVEYGENKTGLVNVSYWLEKAGLESVKGQVNYWQVKKAEPVAEKVEVKETPAGPVVSAETKESPLENPDFQLPKEDREKMDLVSDYLKSKGITKHPYDVGWGQTANLFQAPNRRTFVEWQRKQLAAHVRETEAKLPNEWQEADMLKRVEALPESIAEMEKVSKDVGGFMTPELKVDVDRLLEKGNKKIESKKSAKEDLEKEKAEVLRKIENADPYVRFFSAGEIKIGSNRYGGAEWTHEAPGEIKEGVPDVTVTQFLPKNTRVFKTKRDGITNGHWLIYKGSIPKNLAKRFDTIFKDSGAMNPVDDTVLLKENRKEVPITYRFSVVKNGVEYTIFTTPKNEVVSYDRGYISFLSKSFPDLSLSVDPNKLEGPASLFSGGERVGIIMPMRTDIETGELNWDLAKKFTKIPFESEKQSPAKETEGEVEGQNYGISKPEFEDMIQRQFNTVREYYADEGIKTWKEYLNKLDAETIALEIDSNYELYNRYWKNLPDGVTVSDVIDAYKRGELTQEKASKERTKPLETTAVEAKELGTVGEPKEIKPLSPEDSKAAWGKANTRITKNNAKEVNDARATVFFQFALTEGFADRVGTKQKDIIRKLRSWSNFPYKALVDHQRFNSGKSLPTQWHGIINSAWIARQEITPEQIDQMVKEIDAPDKSWNTPDGQSLRNYIARVLLGVDTRILFNNLTFRVESTLNPLGQYFHNKLLIKIRENSPHTLAHEIGHYLDHKWADEAYMQQFDHASPNAASTMLDSYVGGISPLRKQWLKRFSEFVMDISERSEIGSEYYQDRGEVFARFFAKFIDWTNEKAGQRTWGEQRYSQDRFNEGDYRRFIGLLQEKAFVDIKEPVTKTVSKEGEVSDISPLGTSKPVPSFPNHPSVQAIEKHIDPMLKKLKGLPPVEVVETWESLPKGVKEYYKQKMKTGTYAALYVRFNNGQDRIFIMADRQASLNTALGSLWHEMGHKALRQTLRTDSPEYNAFLDDLYKSRYQDRIDAVAKDYNLDVTTEEGRRRAADEFWAFQCSRESFAQESSYAKRMFDRFVTIVRNFLKSVGINIPMGKSAIRDMMRRSYREMEKEGAAKGPQEAGISAQKLPDLKPGDVNTKELWELNEKELANRIGAEKVYLDNPGGEWLEYEQQRAKEKNGGGSKTASVTRIMFPVDELLKVEGRLGEHKRIFAEDKRVSDLVEKIKKEGFTSTPFVNVEWDGSANINEGNHRIRAAKLVGIKEIPIEIGYYAGGERQDGPFSLAKLAELNRRGTWDETVADISGEKVNAAEKKVFDEKFPKEALDTLKDFRKLWKARGANWRPQRPDTSILDRIASVPSHHFDKVEALQKMFESSLKRPDTYFELLNAITKTEDGGFYTQKLADLKRKDPQEYEKLENWLVSRDRNQIGYKVIKEEDSDQYLLFNPRKQKVGTFDKEIQAWGKAIVLEAEDFRKSGASDLAVESLVGARMITHRGFEVLIRSMRNIIEQFQAEGMVPSVTVNIDGKAVEVNLTVELARMGDIRGYYFPRIRRPGRFMLTARKQGSNPVMEFFDTKIAIANRGIQLEKEGYKVEKDLSPKMPEDVFEMAGGTIALQATINQALAKMKSKSVDLEDFGLSVVSRLVKPGVRDFVVTGPTSKKMTPVFKDLGGKFYSAYPGEARAWHFINAGPNFKKRLAKALGNSVEIVDMETERLFAQAMAEQVANVIKGRGYLSHRIKRTPDKGTDVWVGYEEDPAIALAKYARGLAAGEAKKINAIEMVRAFTGTDESWREFKERTGGTYEDYLEQVEERRVNPSKQPNAFKEGKVYMADMLRNEEWIDRAIGAFKGAAVLKYLGFRVAAPIVNLTALVTSVPAAMNAYGKIPLNAAFRHIGQAMSYYKAFKFGEPNALPAEMRKVFEEIQRRGWDTPQFNEEALSVLEGKVGRGWNKMIEASMWMFGKTEQLNRAATIAGSFIGLKRLSGSMSFDEMLNLAKKISDRSHGVYRKANLPHYVRGGDIGAQVMKSFYVFRTFSHNYLLTMKEVGIDQHNAKAFAYMLLSPAVLAGAGATIATPIIKALSQAFGIGGDDPEEDFYAWLDENLGEYGERVGRYGLFGLLGANVKGSLQIAVTDIPTTIPEVLGAPGSVISDLYHGVRNISKGDVLKGVEKLLPNFAAGISRGYREATEGVTTRTNTPVFYGTEPLVADTVEAIYRGLSFNPARIAGIREKLRSEIETEQAYTEKRTEIYSRFKKFYLRPSADRSEADYIELLNMVSDYNESIRQAGLEGKVPQITSNSIRQALKLAMRPSKKERLRAARQSGMEIQPKETGGGIAPTEPVVEEMVAEPQAEMEAEAMDAGEGGDVAAGGE